jgi:hypothetical protein
VKGLKNQSEFTLTERFLKLKIINANFRMWEIVWIIFNIFSLSNLSHVFYILSIFCIIIIFSAFLNCCRGGLNPSASWNFFYITIGAIARVVALILLRYLLKSLEALKCLYI